MPSHNTYHLTWVSLTLDASLGVSLHGCSRKAQLLLLTLDEGYLLTATTPDLEGRVAPLSPPVPRTTVLSNSMKLSHATWGHPRRMVMVERSDRVWSPGEGNGKPLQYSCLENPMNSMRRQNDRILKEELPRSIGAQYAMGDQWRNNTRKNEGMQPKQK